MNNVWRDIPGYEGLYQASNDGHVKALERKSWNGKVICIRSERLLTPQKVAGGYYQICITPNNKQIRKYLHRLIAEAWISNPDNKPFINHKDGNKSNNSISNLEWCTRSENVKHAFATGLMCNKGEKSPVSKLKEEDVLSIRIRYYIGESTYRIFKSNDYPISYTNIKDIIAKRTWAHI